MSGFLGQLGYVDESTYGTPVTVTKFAEFNNESIAVEVGRVESAGIRAGQRAMRSDRRIPYIMGASGSFEIDVLSKGFGFWLKHMLGTVATTGPAETSVYTHTGTLGTLTGDFFTLQVGVPQIGGGSITPKTCHGGKIKSWELTCAAGETLKFKADCDFEDLEHSTALATASYFTAMEPLTFIGGVATIGGTSTDITDFSVKCDNNLKVDRRYLRTSALKKEPVEAGMRAITAEMTLDFDSLTNQNRVLSATAAGAQANVVLFAQGVGTIGTTLRPRVTITMPGFMFDGDTPTVSGPDIVPQTLKGVALSTNATGDDAISVAYQTVDVTPL